MNNEYFEVELISPRSPSYIYNNKRYKKLSDNVREYKAVDPFAATYNKTLLKWESVVQRLLATLTNEATDRILKYSNTKAKVSYREIDFIAQPSKDELIFCELKLKENFRENLGSKASGWAQLNKALNIAHNKFQQLSGLSICVDMSHVYGIETKATVLDYCRFSELTNYFCKPSKSNKTLWLNSKEIAYLAVKHELLTLKEVNNIKVQFNEYKNPLSIIDNKYIKKVNSPFQGLIKLKVNPSTNAVHLR